jgi:hypothetical protein
MSDAGGRLNYKRRARERSHTSSRSDFSTASTGSDMKGCLALLFNGGGAVAGAVIGYGQGGIGGAVAGGFAGLFAGGAVSAALKL